MPWTQNEKYNLWTNKIKILIITFYIVFYFPYSNMILSQYFTFDNILELFIFEIVV